ncbi:DNA-3-methyladenine glycosylase family protein [Polymorphobacter fuscus]|uniref:DNA-3-methyladenine glycosylase II n=1 Tax=Sandarakinorhabdus fusca TaxID=1439888 RepID=A0A7C9GWR7_9SPHN|nr:DNA-3-methyladenine glycosylase [Polymorphobacter fuscus]KAB7644905.1 DNA-3-methyladenine glycosylase 2 family protein [Polymorphobacter fuscus]MQT18189.1 DNA-3-methyladenine glycosylase 2 family protein [Polymorphobacter fuscus]NJC09509.1 DNA-3-methyladenine glycosylase II [Polymorphobacter fuscus]
MSLTTAQLATALDAIAATEPAIAAALARAGYPEPRGRSRGAATMMRAIVGQQVSVKAAASIWNKLEAACGGDMDDHARVAATPVDALRAAGLSGQKASYVHALAEALASGALDFAALPADDEDAIAALTAVKGIGRWSAEIYLLFAEGRPDVFPAGDLAVQIELGRILGLDARPTEKRTRELAEPWRPNRGALAVFLWHHYNIDALG